MPDVIANKYKIIREIARSNDVVYEAVDTTMGRRLAIKELSLPPNLTGQARRERVERFNREARAAGKLSHPNIVTVYDFGDHDGRHFIVMEYLEGGTLRDAIQSRGALPLQEAVEIVSAVLSGLAHAHTRQVVHRDIKPDNIHILPGGQVKLTDFGIARLMEEASLTGEGQVFGTPSYMSPEQIEGRYVDHRTDLFSVGILLYEMIAGRKPFSGDSVVSITYSIMHNDPAPLVGVPYGVEQVIFRALSKDPGRRFNSADEMRLALKNADSVPSMFLPRQPTGMGTFAPPPPVYGGMGAPAPMYNYPPSGAPSMQPGPPNTVYAPPPQPGQLPQTAGGPFVNWGQTAQPAPPPVYAPAPPPYPRPRPGPILSQGARTFFLSLVIAAVLGGIVVGMVLMFLRAYEEQRRPGPEIGATKLVSQGNQLYEQGDLQAAAGKFADALKMAPDSPAGKTARLNLAVALNRIGTRAYERGDYRTAEDSWHRTLETDPNNEDAHYNLGKLYDRIGDRDSAMREWQRSQDGSRVGGPDPAAPASNTAMQARIERARILYNEGMKAFNSGEVNAARVKWQQAIGEAPGTEFALRAQQELDKSTSEPSF